MRKTSVRDALFRLLEEGKIDFFFLLLLQNIYFFFTFSFNFFMLFFLFSNYVVLNLTYGDFNNKNDIFVIKNKN